MQTTFPEPLAPFDDRAAAIGATLDGDDRALFDTLLARVDRDKLAALQTLYAARVDPERPLAGHVKYIDIPYWIAEKIGQAHILGLTDGRPRRVLDLGCGGGHFLAVCEALGHEAVGVDIPIPITEAVGALLGVDRRLLPVEPHVPLPDELGAFDTITAFMLNFNQLGIRDDGTHIYWTDDDWDFLLRDLSARHMRYPGLLHLQFNLRVLPSGERVRWSGLIDLFDALGARIGRPKSEVWLEVSGGTRLPEVGPPIAAS